MKKDSDNFRKFAIQRVMERIKAKSNELVVYQSFLQEKTIFNPKVIYDF